MDFLKKIALFVGLIICLGWSNSISAQAQNKPIPKIAKTKTPVEFNTEDIEKLKTLVERHLHTKMSSSEFQRYSKPNEDNLEMYKQIDELRKEDPFFSQPHLTFLIESMEERLGLRRPKSKMEMEKNSEGKYVPKVSKLPLHKSDRQ